MESFGFNVSDEPSQVHDMSPFFTDDPPPGNHSFQASPIPAPAFKKSKWSQEEDELLRQFVDIHGLGNWSVISQSVPGRNGKQCRERWMNQLCPALNKENWTPQEDAVLIQQQRVFGNVWSQIAQFLPGRSPNSVKNRWSWLSRHTISASLAARMMPYLVQHAQRQPPSQAMIPDAPQEFTAPPNLLLHRPSGAIPFGPAAFSDPCVIRSDVIPPSSASSEDLDFTMINLFPDARVQPDPDDDKDELVRRLDDWSL
jgi:hypothetical protein